MLTWGGTGTATVTLLTAGTDANSYSVTISDMSNPNFVSVSCPNACLSASSPSYMTRIAGCNTGTTYPDGDMSDHIGLADPNRDNRAGRYRPGCARTPVPKRFADADGPGFGPIRPPLCEYWGPGDLFRGGHRRQ